MKQSHKDKMSAYRSGKKYIVAAQEDAETFREIAQRLGLVVERGRGAGVEGDPKDVLAIIAERYRSDPDGTLDMLKEWQRSATGSDVPD